MLTVLRMDRVVEYRISGSSNGVRVQTPSLNKVEQNEVREKVSWMLGLDQDFSSFYKAARKEPKLRNAEKLARGRVLRSPTFFEDVVKTILTTNTLWAATKRMNLNLIASFGDPLADSDSKAFPTPDRIAASSDKVLRETVRVGYRAPALYELAVRVASEQLDSESIQNIFVAHARSSQRVDEHQRSWPVRRREPVDDFGTARFHPD